VEKSTDKKEQQSPLSLAEMAELPERLPAPPTIEARNVERSLERSEL